MFDDAYVQTQRSKGLVDKRPLFDTSEAQADLEMAETFMADHFGPVEVRRNVRTSTVLGVISAIVIDPYGWWHQKQH